jgi:hypothetical protein
VEVSVSQMRRQVMKSERVWEWKKVPRRQCRLKAEGEQAGATNGVSKPQIKKTLTDSTS